MCTSGPHRCLVITSVANPCICACYTLRTKYTTNSLNMGEAQQTTVVCEGGATRLLYDTARLHSIARTSGAEKRCSFMHRQLSGDFLETQSNTLRFEDWSAAVVRWFLDWFVYNPSSLEPNPSYPRTPILTAQQPVCSDTDDDTLLVFSVQEDTPAVQRKRRAAKRTTDRSGGSSDVKPAAMPKRKKHESPASGQRQKYTAKRVSLYANIMSWQEQDARGGASAATPSADAATTFSPPLCDTNNGPAILSMLLPETASWHLALEPLVHRICELLYFVDYVQCDAFEHYCACHLAWLPLTVRLAFIGRAELDASLVQTSTLARQMRDRCVASLCDERTIGLFTGAHLFAKQCPDLFVSPSFYWLLCATRYTSILRQVHLIGYTWTNTTFSHWTRDRFEETEESMSFLEKKLCLQQQQPPLPQCTAENATASSNIAAMHRLNMARWPRPQHNWVCRLNQRASFDFGYGFGTLILDAFKDPQDSQLWKVVCTSSVTSFGSVLKPIFLLQGPVLTMASHIADNTVSDGVSVSLYKVPTPNFFPAQEGIPFVVAIDPHPSTTVTFPTAIHDADVAAIVGNRMELIRYLSHSGAPNHRYLMHAIRTHNQEAIEIIQRLFGEWAWVMKNGFTIWQDEVDPYLVFDYCPAKLRDDAVKSIRAYGAAIQDEKMMRFPDRL